MQVIKQCEDNIKAIYFISHFLIADTWLKIEKYK